VFVSGVAGLGYEIIFSRSLAIFLGSDGHAIIAVLAAFMGGLAIGNAALGRRADRVPRPLHFYAALEAGIGLYALLFPTLLAIAEPLFRHTSAFLSGGPATLLPLKLAFAIMLLLPPTILMGGTLPTLARAMTTDLPRLGSKLGWLYFLNSLGAAIGCLLADFLLIPDFGIVGALHFNAGLNFGVVLLTSLALGSRPLVDRNEDPATQASPVPPPAAQSASISANWLLAAAACSGFAGMLCELVWTRLLGLILGSATHAFALVAAIFIAGLACGGWLVHRRVTHHPLRWFTRSQFILVAVILLALPAYARLPWLFTQATDWLPRNDPGYRLFLVIQALFAAAVVFLPALLLGASLPLVAQAITQKLAEAGRKTGVVFAWNTIGAVLGIVVTGMFLLPRIGLAATLGVGIGCTCLAATSIRGPSPRLVASLASLVALPLLSGWLFQAAWARSLTLGLWRLPGTVHSLAEFKTITAQNQIKFYADGAASTVSVNAWTEHGHEELNLRVNGKPDASSANDLPTQLLLGHLPMLLRPESSRALVIGLGSGITCHAIATHPAINTLDVVEISPEVARAARLFAPFNGNVLDDPRLRLVVDDARSFLQRANGGYDIIVSEPSNPWIAGVAGVFTREFYEHCRARLQPDGLMVQWIHLYDNSPAALDLVLQTFASVFPQMGIWQSEELDLILIGSAKPRASGLDPLLAELQQPGVAKDLAQIRLSRPAVLLSLEVVSPENGRFLPAPETPPHTDLRPRLEYAAQRGFFQHEPATNCLQWTENLMPGARTLLAEYLRAHPLAREDYDAFAHFFAASHLPAPALFRSLCARWQGDAAARSDLVRLLPILPPLGSTSELEALRLAPLRETILNLSTNDTRLLAHYTSLLREVYLSQRSVSHVPRGTELRATLERMAIVDPAHAPAHQLELAWLALDHGDTNACLELIAKASPGLAPRSAGQNPELARVLPELIQGLGAAGHLEAAGRLFRAAADIGMPPDRLRLARRFDRGPKSPPRELNP
ncbi:MAG TPA: fused MFS/spermidine synthase, partial [Verrucomicrobiae bacterium]|nr:fused MFS/spermidine synthase [Verrucomicrobiae bacterium]